MTEKARFLAFNYLVNCNKFFTFNQWQYLFTYHALNIYLIISYSRLEYMHLTRIELLYSLLICCLLSDRSVNSANDYRFVAKHNGYTLEVSTLFVHP